MRLIETVNRTQIFNAQESLCDIGALLYSLTVLLAIFYSPV